MSELDYNGGSVANELDNFGWSEAISAIGNGIGSIGSAFSAKSEAKAQTAIAKEQGKADVSKAFYGMFGKTDTSGLSQAGNTAIAASLEKKKAETEAEKAQQKKWMWIGIALGGAALVVVVILFIRSKKTN